MDFTPAVTTVPASSMTSATTGVAGDPAATAAAGISSDFNTFLKMLTAQITNQDPMNPMKSEEFAVQLATFSGVEQQVRTNQLLEQVVSVGSGSALSQMAPWIGTEVRAEAPAYFSGAPVTVDPPSSVAGDRHQLVVTDAGGKEVFRAAVDATGSPVTWDGRASAGGTVPAGLYTMSVESFDKGSLVATAPAETYGRVVEARSGKDGVSLVLAGGTSVAADSVTAIRESA